jgi:hypothetical protein
MSTAPRRHLVGALVVATLAVMLVIGATGAWYVLFRPPGPAALDPSALVIPSATVAAEPTPDP